MENNSNNSWSWLNDDIVQGICIALAVIILFASGNFMGAITNVKRESNVDVDAEITTIQTPTTTAPTTQPTTPAPTQDTTTTAPAGDATTTTAAPAEDATTTTAAPSTGAPQTTAEILDVFSKGVNKIKTDATKVVRNYEDLRHNEDKLVLPSLLKSIGSPLISTFLKMNDTPIEYVGNADIIANFPVVNETWATKVTEADITEATCNDNGTEYEITLKYKESVDPQIGSGVASTFNIISAQQVKENAAVVSEFSGRYYDCVAKVKIDKATGNCVWANYTTPIVLSVKAMGIDAQVGMTFETDFSITY